MSNWIPGYESFYSITVTGEVFSHWKHTLRKLKIHYDPVVGYQFVVLRVPGPKKKYTSLRIHRALALTYLGPCPPGFHVSHADGDKLNNQLSNLSYVSPKENTRLAREAGQHNKPGKRFLTQQERDSIRTQKEQGQSNEVIARSLNVHPRSVQRIYREEKQK